MLALLRYQVGSVSGSVSERDYSILERGKGALRVTIDVLLDFQQELVLCQHQVYERD